MAESEKGTALLLGHPDQLTPEVHSRILSKLRGRLSELQKKGKAKSVRIRDWLFAFSDSRPAVQLFLEQPISSTDVIADAALPWASPSLSDCAVVHRWLLECDAFSDFEDSVQIEVGSLGSSPPLREEHEFVVAKGMFLDLTLWGTDSGRRFKGCRLLDVLSDSAGCSIVIEHKNQHMTVVLADVRSAIVMSRQEPRPPSAKPSLNQRTGKISGGKRDKS